VAGTGAPSAQARIVAGRSGYDRGAAVSRDDQAVGGERLQRVPDNAGPDALQGAQLSDRRQLVAGREDPGPDGLCERLSDLLPGRAGVVRVDLGAGERIRTAGLPFTRRLLCLLSYTGRRLAAS
jgi:hypothetical protein